MPVMETRKKPWSGWSYDPWSFQFLSKTGGADGEFFLRLFPSSVKTRWRA